MKRWAAFLMAGLVATVAAQAADQSGRFAAVGYDDDQEARGWQELEIEPPPFPTPANLREFYVSAVATNKYFVDASTLAVGDDGIVRYVLVVKTSGGATNVSFEGIHCKEFSWKHFATGGNDGTWTKARGGRNPWRPIENKPVNRYHAALSREFFCPMGTPINTADEGRDALRLGKHPDSN